MKLEAELVPKPLWRKYLANMLSRDEWKRLRAQRIREKGESCEICGQKGRVHLHEIWKYDDESYVQRLVGFQLLCDNCHSIKHFGRTQTLAAECKLDLRPIIIHFCKVNNCTPEDLKDHWKSVFDVWKERSQHQ